MESLNENLIDLSTPLKSDETDQINEMAALSKEAESNLIAQSKPPTSSSRSNDSIFNVIYSIVKKVTVVGAIYLVGYMNWSVAWLITPVVLAVTREFWQKSSQVRREIAKASATANEKDVILARISDLPAWVKYIFLKLTQMHKY